MLKNLNILCIGCIFFATALAGFSAKQSPAKKLSHLPPPVQKTIKDFLGDGKLGAIETDTEDGEVSYDVEIIKQGKTRYITVDAEGHLIYVQVFLEETPAAVQKAVATQLGTTGKPGDIYKAIDGNEISYEVEMTKDGNAREFSVGTDGKLLDMEVFLTELPTAIQQGIQKQSGDGKISSITKNFDAEGISYDVETSKDKQKYFFSVDSKGSLISEEIALSAAPEAVQKVIKAQLGNAKLVAIDKNFEKNKITYEVELKKEGRTQSLRVSPDGKIIPK